jgi:hypothetical protein
MGEWCGVMFFPDGGDTEAFLGKRIDMESCLKK